MIEVLLLENVYMHILESFTYVNMAVVGVSLVFLSENGGVK